jgi:thioredoxin domain-containing protein 5
MTFQNHPTTLMRGSLAALVCFLAIGWATSEVVTLTDDTLEHQTQASTGATTGSWLLMFGTPTGCSACSQLKPLFEELGQDEVLYEGGIVLGSVDINESPTAAMRFGIRSIPSLVYLHKGSLYRFPSDIERSVESMKEFVLEHYSKSPAEAIPPPPSPMDQILDVWNKLQESGMAFYVILIMAFFLLGTIGVLIVALLGGGGKKSAAKKD